MKELDFYAGFEGEPEIRFALRVGTETVCELRTWNGYFDKVMSKVKPEANGWTSLALEYHTTERWYDESPWRLPDVAAAFAQWRNIDVSDFGLREREFHTALLGLFEQAVQRDAAIWITYD